MINHKRAFFAFLALAVLLGTNSAQANVIVGLVLNPFSTAGAGSTSTRSGPSSWHLYAIDDSSADFGISSYNITMSGTTAINHRAPVTTINDGNGDPQAAGFNLLRTATNVNPIQSSQGLPGSTPFMITGFGQTASDFTTKATAIDAGAAVVGPTTSGAWGNYSNPVLTQGGLLSSGSTSGFTAAAAAVAAGKKWVFLAEGLGYDPRVTAAVVTVFTNPNFASGATTSAIINILELDSSPPPMASSTTINNVTSNVPGSVSYTFTADQAVTWGSFSFVSGPSPAKAAFFDPATRGFSWNPLGSPIGSYKWSVRASNFNGIGTGFITVNVTVPEPATWSFAALGLIGCLFSSRPRTFCGRV